VLEHRQHVVEAPSQRGAAVARARLQIRDVGLGSLELLERAAMRRGPRCRC
jgi:hypothetical protein